MFAAFFAKKKQTEVWLLDKNPKRAKKIKESGIEVEGISGAFKVKVNITNLPEEIKGADLFILCVKSYDTEEAVKTIEPVLAQDSNVLTLQNGLGNIEIISEIVGRDRVLGGVTSHGATLLEDGHIRHAGRGDTVIGRMDGKLTVSMREIRDIFNRAGFSMRLSKDINSLIWSKLIINVGINAQTAITRLNNGRLIGYPGTREIMELAVSEAVRVAKKNRIKLIYEDPIQKVESVCLATAENISSMLQDILKKKRTEIDYINGAIIRKAKSLGVDTPVNLVLTNLVKTIESTYDKQLK